MTNELFVHLSLQHTVKSQLTVVQSLQIGSYNLQQCEEIFKIDIMQWFGLSYELVLGFQMLRDYLECRLRQMCDKWESKDWHDSFFIAGLQLLFFEMWPEHFKLNIHQFKNHGPTQLIHLLFGQIVKLHWCILSFVDLCGGHSMHQFIKSVVLYGVHVFLFLLLLELCKNLAI